MSEEKVNIEYIIDSIQKGLEVEFRYDSPSPYGVLLIIKGIVTDLYYPDKILELLNGKSLHIKGYNDEYLLEKIQLIKSNVSAPDKFMDLRFTGYIRLI